jgi:hypothetical protein
LTCLGPPSTLWVHLRSKSSTHLQDQPHHVNPSFMFKVSSQYFYIPPYPLPQGHHLIHLYSDSIQSHQCKLIVPHACWIHPQDCIPHPTLDGGSTSTKVARTSPTGRFFACSDQIEALIDQEAWVHGAVINTLGDLFCYGSYSKPIGQCFEILSTHLFHWWETRAQGCQINHSTCFKGVASPLECRAWLVPILFKHHWYLLVVDWIDHELQIHDSLATLGVGPPSRLVEYGAVLMGYVNEDFGIACQGWPVIPDQVRHFRCILA